MVVSLVHVLMLCPHIEDTIIGIIILLLEFLNVILWAKVHRHNYENGTSITSVS